MEFREWEREVKIDSDKFNALRRAIEQKESSGECACSEWLEIAKICRLHHVDCKTCFNKRYVDNPSLAHEEWAYLDKKWTEEKIHPGV